MTKNEFLRFIAAEFLSEHPAWEPVWEHRRWFRIVVGRQIAECVVYLEFDARPDRYRFGQGVGWAPSKQTLITELTAPRTTEFKPTDGRLDVIRQLPHPRDFAYSSLRRSVGSLARPFTTYDLAPGMAPELRVQMLADVDSFAIPYLCLMLHARHRLTVTPERLATSAVLHDGT